MRTLYLNFLVAAIIVSFNVQGLADNTESPLTIAISDFATKGGNADQQWVGNSCIEAIVSKLSGQKNIKVVERQYLNKIIDEIKLQASGLVDENTAVEAGNLVAVKYFVIGSATISETNLMIRVRVVDVATSQIKTSSEVSGNLNEIFKLQNELTQKIAAGLTLGSVTFESNDAGNQSNMTFSVANKLEKIKKLADALPFFTLDPARKRKSSEYMLAINMCDDLIEKFPTLQKAHYYKGLFSIQSEDFTSSDIESKEAKNLDKEDADAYLLRAFHFYVNEKFTEAEQALNYASTKFPYDARIWYALAKVNLGQNNNTAALENLINSLNNSPYLEIAETNLRALLGSTAISASSFSNSKYYTIAILYKVMYNLGYSLNEKTYALAKEITVSAPNFAVPFYLMALYEKAAGNALVAENNFFAAIRLKPTFAEAHRDFGSLLLANGKCKAGKRHVELYMQSTNAAADFTELHTKIKNCN
jgi:TolB-like protein